VADSEHVAILKQGVEPWSKWRVRNPIVRPDLSLADFRDGDFRYVNFYGANLHGTNLSGANLSYANLHSADLSGAKLDRANLSNASLCGANLKGVNLCGVDLSSADLKEAYCDGTNLSDANLSQAMLGDTKLINTDLHKVKGLESCSHKGPSYLDYFTLSRSGRLPVPFLRGCGLSDEFIDYLPSLFSEAIQFFSCFISYSTKDQEFADRLYADLQNKGVRCWFAPHDIQSGKKIHEQIDEAIRVYDRLLLIISEDSMSSRWVKTEIANARKKEIELNRQVLFPVRLVSYEQIKSWKLFDAEIGDDSAREIREYFIPDFSDWKSHDSYQKGFNRLLRDLKPQQKADKAEKSPTQ
jgi:uncharacterized protein YjbI with pentapeptide repeats